MLSNKNRFIKPTKKDTVKYPYVDLIASTWTKDSHALYDYESTQSKFTTESFEIFKNCKIYRNIGFNKTFLINEEENKDLHVQNIYIASILFNPIDRTCKIQSADASGVLPNSVVRQQHPDLFRNSFLVVRDLQKIAGKEGYPLEIGNFIKLGRVEYLVIELRDNNQTRTLKELTNIELNNGVYQVLEEQLVGSCKVCLCEESTPQDPLINPCNCKGSCELIHVGCLKNWINSKVKRELHGIAISYNFSKFQCQICKALFPKIVLLEDGTVLDMIIFDKPNKPYIVLESLTEKGDKKDASDRLIHVISPDERYPVKMGRGHMCEIKITDISVSRSHGQITLLDGTFYLKDLKSKFGTLVKFREQIELSQKIQIQYGRTCFNFKLNRGIETQSPQNEAIQKSLEQRPQFTKKPDQRSLSQMDRQFPQGQQ